VKLTNSTVTSPEPDYQALLSSVEDAIRLGADGISVQVDCRAKKEPEMLEILGMTAEACDHWGIPLVAMMYFVADEKTDAFDADALGHVARIGSELGADIIKTRYTGNPDTFKKVVTGAGGPVVIAGGPKVPGTKDVLKMVSDSLEAGGIGVSMGRNVFAHENPTKMAKALAKVIHEEASVDKAMAELR
jgi:DhnA family fructose-bisphosphate aldolase class Ia